MLKKRIAVALFTQVHNLFIESTLLESPEKACNRVSTTSTVVFEKMEKNSFQLIINYDVMRDSKEVKFVEVGKSGTGFRFS